MSHLSTKDYQLTDLALATKRRTRSQKDTPLYAGPRRMFLAFLLLLSFVGSQALRMSIGARGDFLSSLSSAIAEAEAVPKEAVQLTAGRSGFGGGGGASVGTYKDEARGVRYFVKSGGLNSFDMLRAEFCGLKDLEAAEGIRVPRPIAYGTSENNAFAVFEYLDFSGGGDGREMGRLLAQTHRYTSEDGRYGWQMDNTIGATPQPNGWIDNWADFWIERRLKHMLRLAGTAGIGDADALIEKTRDLLKDHEPEASILHGDLWGGNAGYVKFNANVEPVIYDPATYFGDRETDIAMTYLFGGFGSSFYQGYEEAWPLPEGHEKRRVVYNLYHILNHYVLFGGGYMQQARGMARQIMTM